MLDYNLNGTVSRNYQEETLISSVITGLWGIWGPGACGLTIRKPEQSRYNGEKRQTEISHGVAFICSVPFHDGGQT